MRQFAENTNVSVEKTKGAIEAIVTQAGADAFASMSDTGRAAIQFRLRSRILRFTLPLPDKNDPKFSKCGRYNERTRTAEATYAAWEQACRSKWRALFLSIKAKLHSIESGIETFDSAFMAQIVMPSGQTMEEVAVPLIEQAYKSGKMPTMNLLALTDGK